MAAPVASGWNGSRVGLAPTGKAPHLHGARQKLSFETTAGPKGNQATHIQEAVGAITPRRPQC